MRVNMELYQHTSGPALLQRFFRESLSSGYAWRLLGIPLTLIVALLDYYTGNELNVSVLYLLPIALASWKLAKEEAVVVAAFSAVVWFVEDYLILRRATSLWIPLLNMVALFGYFLAMVLVLSALRKAFAAQQRLIGELQASLGQVKTLSGLLPICSWCKKVRDDQGYWTAVEAYIQKYSLADVTHGICPDCLATYFAGGKGHEDLTT
jgi:hypothetical protein